MAFPFLMVAVWVGVTVLQYLLAKQLQPSVAKRGPGELQAPIAEQGHPVPVVYGTVQCKGANCVWSSTNAQNDNDGNWIYYASLMLAICHGRIDRVRRVWIGSGEKLPKATRISASGQYPLHSVIGTTTLTSTDDPTAGDRTKRPTGTFVVGTDPVSIWAEDRPDEFRNNWHMGDGTEYEELPILTPPPGAYITWKGYDYPGSWEPIITMPALGDTIILNGTIHRWTGTAWEIPPALTWSGTEWELWINEPQSGTIASGFMRIYDGAMDQPSDANLSVSQSRPTGETPAFGGLCYAVFSANLTQFGSNGKFYWGKSPQIPAVSFEVERCPDPLAMGDSYAAIECATLPDQLEMPPGARTAGNTYNANPAWIILDLLMSPEYGLGVPLADIDQPSFRDAARILKGEALGMSMLLDAQSSFDEVVSDVLKTIDGVLFPDVVSGQWQLRVVRKTYTTGEAASLGLETTYYTRTDWPSFNDDDLLEDPEYSRTGWGDVANEIKVQYIDAKEAYSQRVVQVQDLANWTSQNGETVSVSNVFNGINSRELAIRLAYRELKTFGYPRSSARITLNRKAWALRPGDCLVFNSTALGISNMQMRIGDVRYGTLDSPNIVIECIEDVFSLPETGYVPPGSGWVDPSTVAPVAPAAVRAWELAYDVTRDGPRVGFAALAVRGDQYTTGATVWGKIGNGQFQNLGEIGYTPSALLTYSIAREEMTSTITLQGDVDIAQFTANPDRASGENLLLIDDEVMAFQGISIGENYVTVSGIWRGVLDTIPRAHDAGVRVWLIRRPPPVLNPKTIADHSEIFGVVASNTAGEMDPYTVPLYGGQTTSRELRPFVPGRFRIGYDPGTTGTFTDLRDGKVYKTVLMPDGKWWSAENLAWNGSGLDRDNNPSNRAVYGKLYSWVEAASSCPSGTHLPTDSEWTTMEVSLGNYFGVNNPSNTSAYVLKTKTGWDLGYEGSDSFGFSAVPAGYYISPIFYPGENSIARFWTATPGENPYPTTSAWFRTMEYLNSSTKMMATSLYDKAMKVSVRFIVDSGNIPDLVPATEMAENVTPYIQPASIPLAWANRNRLTQAPGVLSQQSASVTMEVGQTNRIQMVKGTKQAITFSQIIDGNWVVEPAYGVSRAYTGIPTTWGSIGSANYWRALDNGPLNFNLPPAPSSTGTVYYYYTIDGRAFALNDYNGGAGSVGYDNIGPTASVLVPDIRDGRVYLFRADWVNTSGNMSVTLTDLRGTFTSSVRTGMDSTVESTNVLPSEILLFPYDAKSPQSFRLFSERDGLQSMETRLSPYVFEAGYGMAYGLSYGGD